MNFTSKFLTNIGWLKVVGSYDFIESTSFTTKEPIIKKSDALWEEELFKQLTIYFNCQKIEFDLPLKPKGTDFQLRVWSEIKSVPHGQTITYKELSERMKHPKAIRAIAAANSKNPILLFIPCHRIIGQNGKLVGYSAGIYRKEFLLNLENGIVSNQLF